MGCWRGYLSGARCRLAYGLAGATATATRCLLLQYNLVPAHPGSPGQRAVKRVCVCVITIINDRYRVFRLRGGGGGVCDATLPRSGPAFSVDRRIASCRADSQVIDPFLPSLSQCSRLASRRRGNLVATLQRLIYSSRRVLYERQTTYPREHTRGQAALRPQ